MSYNLPDQKHKHTEIERSVDKDYMRESSSDTARKMEEKTMSKYREIRNKGSNRGSSTAREGVVEMSGASHIDRVSLI